MPLPKNDFGTDPAASDTAAPLALSLLRQHDYGSSLMDRAQRQRRASDEFGARAQALREQAATTTLPQEAQLAALDRQTQQLADAERTQTGHRRLRETFDAEELDLSLLAISAAADPIDQRLRLTQLRSRYAPFAFNPELAQRIDAQFAAVEPVVQRNEQALAFTSVMSGRYAPTLAEARRAFPGRQINTLVDPASGATLFIASNGPDPYLQAEAMQLVQNARTHAELTGDTAELDAVRADPTFREVARIPGNLASESYREALQATRPAATAPEGGFFLGGDYRVLQRKAHGSAEVHASDSHISRSDPPAAPAVTPLARESAASSQHAPNTLRPAVTGPNARQNPDKKVQPPQTPKRKSEIFDPIKERNRAISDAGYEDQLRAASGLAEVVTTGAQLAADLNPVTSLAQLLEGRSVTGDEYDSTDYLLESISLVPMGKVLPAILKGRTALKALQPVAEIAALGHRYKVPTDPEKMKKIKALTRDLYEKYQPKIKLKRTGPERPSREHPGKAIHGIALPTTKTIELYPRSNQASLLEELLHIKQIVDEGQLGKTARGIDDTMRARWEDEVHEMLLELGFEPIMDELEIDWGRVPPQLPTKRRGGRE